MKENLELLKPCCHCKNTTALEIFHVESSLGYWVSCKTCKNTGLTFNTKLEAIEYWNKNCSVLKDEKKESLEDKNKFEQLMFYIHGVANAFQWTITVKIEDIHFIFLQFCDAKKKNANMYFNSYEYNKNQEIVQVKIAINTDKIVYIKEII